MDVCELISVAECCLVEKAAKYADELSMGGGSDKEFYELLSLFGAITALERYEQHPVKKVYTGEELVDGAFSVVDGNDSLYLNTNCSNVCVDPDEVNCLSTVDLTCIEELILSVCETCKSNC
jgi:hypothetical protein